ncbi:MAG: PrsW family intramembrane metalloprotease [Firmicutes bacterium]|nr:PrsW family intramembrane metalloprotease [Bacillota bacterium]
MSNLLYLSILPSIIIGILIYKADKVEKEPKKELAKSFLLGILAVIITLVISYALGIHTIRMDSLGVIGKLFYNFLGIALIEEFSKLLCTYFFINKNKNYNYLFDGIVYSVFVSLGFATIENILYAFTGGIMVAIIRAITTVPSHAFYAIFMGYYLSKFKKEKKNIYLMLSILIPTVLHGTFDYLLSFQNMSFLLIFLVFVIVLYRISFKKIKQSMDEEESFEKLKENICKNCGALGEGNYCVHCGTKL